MRQSHVRLSHLSAAAVLVALVAAMFVSLGSVRAQTVVNFCQTSGTVLQGQTQTCVIDSAFETTAVTEAAVTDDKDDDGDTTTSDTAPGDGVVTVGTRTDSDGRFVITATEAGSTTLILTETGDFDGDAETAATPRTFKYPITVVETLAISLGDSDNILPAPSEREITITVLDKAAAITVEYVRVSGTLRVRGGEPASGNSALSTVATYNDAKAKLIIPAGTPVGDYVVSAELTNRPGTGATDAIPASGAFRRVIELPIKVGDPGLGLAEVKLSLGVKDNKGTADPSDDVAETGTSVASGGESNGINLVAEAFNSIGSKANAGDVSTISVIANGGTIDVQLTVDDADTTAEPTPVPNTVAVTAPDLANNINQKVTLKVWKTDGKPGTVSVYVFMTGAGAATSNTLELTFTGPAATLKLGDARGIGAPGMTEFTISALDAGGSNAALSALAYKVTDAEGNDISRNLVDLRLGYVGESTDDSEADDNKRASAVILDVAKGTKPGVYTVEVSLVGVKDSAATTTFTVAGSATNVDVMASSTSSDTIGDVITVTATVSDKDGNTIADGTPVIFDVSEDTGLAAIGTGHGDGTADDPAAKTKGGKAMVKYAVVGAGSSVVSAEAGGATGVVVIKSTAGEEADDAMAEEEASVSCLSSLSGFSTWSCGVETSASEIFGLVSGRGATAVHLWNGSAWVRYSVVDGQEVPGSSDFMVAENDILYISN